MSRKLVMRVSVFLKRFVSNSMRMVNSARNLQNHWLPMSAPERMANR
ncbi:MAG: hypothetical protein ABIO59_07430 [Luteimonas sp.]